MAQFRLYLFGPPRLESDGQPVEIQLRKAMALLSYLVVTRQTHARDALATLFWPEKNQQTARANLRRTLFDLGQLVANQVLDTTQETVGLHPAATIWLDTATFQQGLAECLPPHPPVESLSAANVVRLVEIADLYTDDFLAGFTLPDCPAFDDWQFFQREELRRSYATLLQQLTHTHETQGKLEEAARFARRWLQLDPLEETVHRRLMALYAQAGQAAAALRQYEECVRILAEELEVEPEEETTALYDAIRTRRFAPPTKAIANAERGVGNGEWGIPLPTTHSPLPPPPSSLPAQTTPFIGREQEVAEIVRRLRDPACRLLTLVGPGGIGKTRLAIEAARSLVEAPPAVATPYFADGILFVPLQAVSEVDGLVTGISEALGIRPYGEGSPRRQLLDTLRQKQLLVVLDSFEHLLAEGDLVADILACSPGAKILITSREALDLQEAWFQPIAGMAFPKEGAGDGGAFRDYDAVNLFVQRARHVQMDFSIETERAHVMRICRLVDGVPLALELAAAWLKVLPCRQIADEIERGLDILTARHQNIPARHRSMYVVLEQSWQLLSAAEQQVLKQLAVFRGGFTQDAALTVAGASLPTLASLVEKALVWVTPSGRYHMHELLRQYAQQQWAANADEEGTIRTRHSAYYLRFLSPRASLLIGRARRVALEEIAQEIENVRAAWQWAAQQGDLIALHEAVEPLYHFYQIQSRYQEGKDLFVQAWECLRPLSGRDEHSGAALTPVRILARCGAFCYFLCEYDLAGRYLEECLALAQRAGDQAEVAFVLNFLGKLTVWQGEQAAAQRYLRESLAISQAIGDKSGAASALEKLANLTHATFGEYAESKRLAAQSLALSRELGRPDWIAYALDTLGFVTFCLGEYADAEGYYRESLGLFEMIGDQYGTAMAQGGIALVLWAMPGGKQAEAIEYFEKSLHICRTIGHQGQVAGRLAGLARIANDLGDYEKAQQLAREGLTLAHEVGSPVYLSHILYSLGQAAYETGALRTAREHLVEALRLSAETGLLANLAIALFHYAALLIEESRQEATQKGEQGNILKVTAYSLLLAVQRHPATWHVYKERAAARLADLAAQLPASALAAAQSHTENHTLEETVADLLKSV